MILTLNEKASKSLRTRLFSVLRIRSGKKPDPYPDPCKFTFLDCLKTVSAKLFCYMLSAIRCLNQEIANKFCLVKINYEISN